MLLFSAETNGELVLLIGDEHKAERRVFFSLVMNR
jgi:hypothetical protein